MKTYTLKIKKGKSYCDVQITIEDLIPINHKRNYSLEQLVNFLNYSKYKPDWSMPMEQEY